ASGGGDLLDGALAEAVGRDLDALRERARGQELAGHEDGLAVVRVAVHTRKVHDDALLRRLLEALRDVSPDGRFVLPGLLLEVLDEDPKARIGLRHQGHRGSDSFDIAPRARGLRGRVRRSRFPFIKIGEGGVCSPAVPPAGAPRCNPNPRTTGPRSSFGPVVRGSGLWRGKGGAA